MNQKEYWNKHCSWCRASFDERGHRYDTYSCNRICVDCYIPKTEAERIQEEVRNYKNGEDEDA